MKNNYSCKICDEYSTNRVCELNRHLTKKKPCMKSIKSFDYSNDQLIVLSLTPNDELENVKTKICHLDKSNIIYKNKLELLSIIKMIDIDKLKKCTLCNEEYSKKLIEKLKEETEEFSKNPNEEEIADILEVIENICKDRKFDSKKINSIKEEKKIKRGGFDKKIILEKTEKRHE